MVPDVWLDPVPQLARVAHVSQIEKANLRVHQDVQAIGSGDRRNLPTHMLLLLIGHGGLYPYRSDVCGVHMIQEILYFLLGGHQGE